MLASDPVQARSLDAGRRSPLAYAAGRGHTRIVGKLLDLGADTNLPEENAPRGGALFSACSGNHLETAKLLLERGADPNAEVDSSGSCLTIVEYNHGEKGCRLQALLREHGAVTPPYRDMDDAELERAVREGGAVVSHPQFLHELMGRNNAELIGVFLETTPNVRDLFRLTDIWGGNYPSDPDTIRTLASHGLDLCRANWIGRTFLHGCAEKGDVEAARVFLELGAEIDAIELEYGGTPLAAAARSGKAEMVRFLLDQGADPTIPCRSRSGRNRSTAPRRKGMGRWRRCSKAASILIRMIFSTVIKKRFQRVQDRASFCIVHVNLPGAAFQTALRLCLLATPSRYAQARLTLDVTQLLRSSKMV